MPTDSATAKPTPKRDTSPTPLRLDCLPAGACYVCSQQMVQSSGGKWLCRACGFLLTCCDS